MPHILTCKKQGQQQSRSHEGLVDSERCLKKSQWELGMGVMFKRAALDPRR
jgi:hypothetical protein